MRDIILKSPGDKITMINETYKGMTIKTARPTGGKAGRNNNRTSTVQVIDPEGLLRKQIRYKVSDGREGILRAFRKARAFVDGKEPERGGARPGSGAKPSLEGGKLRPTYLDDPTESIFLSIGEDELSQGARRAAIVIALLPSKELRGLLERAKEIERKNIERIRNQKSKED